MTVLRPHRPARQELNEIIGMCSGDLNVRAPR